LQTCWQSGAARLTLTEGLVGEVGGRLLPAGLLVRRIEATDAPVQVMVRFDPRHGDDRSRPRVADRAGALTCTWGANALALTCDAADPIRAGEVQSLTVQPGRPVTFAVSVASREPLILVAPQLAWQELGATRDWWQHWADDVQVDVGSWRDVTVRSL